MQGYTKAIRRRDGIHTVAPDGVLFTISLLLACSSIVKYNKKTWQLAVVISVMFMKEKAAHQEIIMTPLIWRVRTKTMNSAYVLDISEWRRGDEAQH